MEGIFAPGRKDRQQKAPRSFQDEGAPVVPPGFAAASRPRPPRFSAPTAHWALATEYQPL